MNTNENAERNLGIDNWISEQVGNSKQQRLFPITCPEGNELFTEINFLLSLSNLAVHRSGSSEENVCFDTSVEHAQCVSVLSLSPSLDLTQRSVIQSGDR